MNTPKLRQTRFGFDIPLMGGDHEVEWSKSVQELIVHGLDRDKASKLLVYLQLYDQTMAVPAAAANGPELPKVRPVKVQSSLSNADADELQAWRRVCRKVLLNTPEELDSHIGTANKDFVRMSIELEMWGKLRTEDGSVSTPEDVAQHIAELTEALALKSAQLESWQEVVEKYTGRTSLGHFEAYFKDKLELETSGDSPNHKADSEPTKKKRTRRTKVQMEAARAAEAAAKAAPPEDDPDTSNGDLSKAVEQLSSVGETLSSALGAVSTMKTISLPEGAVEDLTAHSERLSKTIAKGSTDTGTAAPTEGDEILDSYTDPEATPPATKTPRSKLVMPPKLQVEYLVGQTYEGVDILSAKIEPLSEGATWVLLLDDGSQRLIDLAGKLLQTIPLDDPPVPESVVPPATDSDPVEVASGAADLDDGKGCAPDGEILTPPDNILAERKIRDVIVWLSENDPRHKPKISPGLMLSQITDLQPRLVSLKFSQEPDKIRNRVHAALNLMTVA